MSIHRPLAGHELVGKDSLSSDATALFGMLLKTTARHPGARNGNQWRSRPIRLACEGRLFARITSTRAGERKRRRMTSHVAKIGPTQMTGDNSEAHSSDVRPGKPETKVVAMLGGFGGLGLAVGKGLGESIGGSLGGWIGLGVGFAVGGLLAYPILRLLKLSVPFHPTVSSFVAMGLLIAIVSALGHLFAGVTGGWIALSIFCLLAILFGFAKRPRMT